MSFSPVYTALLGQAGDRGGFDGRLTSGPTVLSARRGYGVDLSVVGGVLVHVLDLQLATSHSHLIPHYGLVTDNLFEEGERQTDRQWTKRKPLDPLGKHSTGAYSVMSRAYTLLQSTD